MTVCHEDRIVNKPIDILGYQRYILTLTAGLASIYTPLALADYNESVNRTTAALQDADRTVTSALQSLAVRYENATSKTSLETQTTKITNSPIETIVCGFCPDTSTATCPSSSSTAQTEGFTSCLVKPYPNALCCEVRFQNSFQRKDMPGALSGKKVLFIAEGPGMVPKEINKSDSSWTDSDGNETSTPADMDHVAHFICYNPDGTPGDGVNNGGRMGTFALCDGGCDQPNAQITLYPLTLNLRPLSSIGSLVSCLDSNTSHTE